VQLLDPLTLPLHGCRLLEASAGTGKTYTLALLFLRLLLERGLAVDQILVVTFTRAATGELRDRIRRRLREALDHLEHRETADDQLAALLATISPELAQQQLDDALVRMDEAAIHTIHGFCQRILQDHAFESGMPFEVELLESEVSLRHEVIADFWRNRFYPASEDEAAWAAATWGDPAGLLKALGNAVTAASCDLIPKVDTRELDELAEHTRRLFAEVRQAWTEDRDQVRTILEQDPCLQRSDKAYRPTDRVPELVAAMEQLAARPEPPTLLPRGIDRLAASVMAGLVLKKCAEPPAHPFFALFDRFHHTHDLFLRRRTIHVLLAAWHYLRTELDRRKRAHGRLAFDDLLTRLDAALERPRSGPHLAARIAARYPAALVDEFQDTDPVQYRLFSRIYRQGAGSLFLIGDPKQAIYSFRGADIFTYIRARRDTTSANRSTLGVNHRSTPAMVRAVNTLFGRRPDAFVFTDDIAFQPVQAAAGHKAQPLLLAGQAVPPLTALLLDTGRLKNERSPTISKERAIRAAVDFCADTLVRLLEEAAQGRATIAGKPLDDQRYRHPGPQPSRGRGHADRAPPPGAEQRFVQPDLGFCQRGSRPIAFGADSPNRPFRCRPCPHLPGHRSFRLHRRGYPSFQRRRTGLGDPDGQPAQVPADVARPGIHADDAAPPRRRTGHPASFGLGRGPAPPDQRAPSGRTAPTEPGRPPRQSRPGALVPAPDRQPGCQRGQSVGSARIRRSTSSESSPFTGPRDWNFPWSSCPFPGPAAPWTTSSRSVFMTGKPCA
jgi:exodeoxyribonuclease V beta subunit